ncbi:hypothetical protein [Blautia producta]|nr:hypothetical protein [Blautia sp.]MCQ4745298.1 hypothetical protein [Blautia producta]
MRSYFNDMTNEEYFHYTQKMAHWRRMNIYEG